MNLPSRILMAALTPKSPGEERTLQDGDKILGYSNVFHREDIILTPKMVGQVFAFLLGDFPSGGTLRDALVEPNLGLLLALCTREIV